MNLGNNRHPASFRDPSGFIFRHEGRILRQVNQRYAPVYDLLMDSGLYADLVARGWLIAHEDVDLAHAQSDLAYKVLAPQQVPFISYPYEWSFSMLKDAALLTLEIQLHALEHGMILKDCSAYNIQFVAGKPTFIDTLSFDRYEEGRPWDAYRQFCQHFLAPLALMAHTDVRLSQMLRVNLDGIPLDLASRLLPRKTRRNMGLQMHIHMHARAQQRYTATDKGSRGRQIPQAQTFSKMRMLGLVDSLRTAVQKLTWQPVGTEWVSYYDDNNNYTTQSLSEKETLVERFIAIAAPQTVWDLGANTGRFSRLASKRGIETNAFDIDPAAVECAYLLAKEEGDEHLLALVMDLSNPSPGLGWAGVERDSLLARAPADMVFALALLHHLVIANNIPMEFVADFLSRCGKYAVVEFVPRQDSQVQTLLSTRIDIFQNYTREAFQEAFAPYFEVIEMCELEDSERTLFLFRARA